MRLWRISEFASLDGAGGLYAAGRWNSIGQPITYLAESSALALLEALVRRSRTVLPAPYQLLDVHVPDDVAATRWPVDQDAHDRPLTTAWGDAFLRARSTALARVPSVIAPASWNYLLNPLHPDAARIRIARAARWPWDARLFGRD